MCGLTDDGLVSLRRFSSKLFSSQSYEVKPNDIYTVPNYYDYHTLEPITAEESSSSDEDETYEEENHEHEPLHESTHQPSHQSAAQQENPADSREKSTTSTNEIPIPLPPIEITNPATDNSPNIVNSRLRPRKPINYNESIEDSFINYSWVS